VGGGLACRVGPARGLRYPHGVHWAHWERAGAQPVHGVLAQCVLGCGLLEKPLHFPAIREFGDQTLLGCGLMLGFWVIAPGSGGNASQQLPSNPPERCPAGTEETKRPSAGLVQQPDRDVSVLAPSPRATCSSLPVEDGVSALVLHTAVPRMVWMDTRSSLADDCLPWKIRDLAPGVLIPWDNLSWKCQQ